jgi:hypothetical protein
MDRAGIWDSGMHGRAATATLDISEYQNVGSPSLLWRTPKDLCRIVTLGYRRSVPLASLEIEDDENECRNANLEIAASKSQPLDWAAWD